LPNYLLDDKGGSRINAPAVKFARSGT